MAKFLDVDHPMFRPLWVRVAIVALCVGWAVFEFVGGSGMWGILFLALGLYAAREFFLKPRAGQGKDED
jgi:hypothetical protein